VADLFVWRKSNESPIGRFVGWLVDWILTGWMIDWFRFGSVEQYWRIYSHLVRPGELSSHSDFHLFKSGIKPMWEDDANKCGGKWIVRLR